MMPLITVLMSVKNDTNNFLSQSIKSILGQTFEKFEFIIIADGSDANTKNILYEYAKLDKRIILIEQDNLGLTKSLNKGIKLAKSKYIARQDFDDISHSERLAKQYKLMNSNKDYVVCGTFCKKIDINNKVIGKIKNSSYFSYHKKKIQYYNTLIHPSVMFRKQEIISIGLYNESFTCSQDYDLWSRVIKKNNITNLNEYLLNLRLHSNSISSKNNYTQRVYSFYIILKYKFPQYDSLIKSSIKLDPIDFFNLTIFKNKKFRSYTQALLYVLLYDKISFIRILNFSPLTIYYVAQYYLNRPSYIYFRLRYL